MVIVNSAIDEMMPEFDPTNPNANYGDLVRVSGDAALNALTGGAAGTVFSQGAQGVEDLNELTDNTFTAESIREIAEDFIPMPEEVTEPVIEEITENFIGDIFGSIF